MWLHNMNLFIMFSVSQGGTCFCHLMGCCTPTHSSCSSCSPCHPCHVIANCHAMSYNPLKPIMVSTPSMINHGSCHAFVKLWPVLMMPNMEGSKKSSPEVTDLHFCRNLFSQSMMCIVHVGIYSLFFFVNCLLCW